MDSYSNYGWHSPLGPGDQYPLPVSPCKRCGPDIGNEVPQKKMTRDSIDSITGPMSLYKPPANENFEYWEERIEERKEMQKKLVETNKILGYSGVYHTRFQVHKALNEDVGVFTRWELIYAEAKKLPMSYSRRDYLLDTFDLNELYITEWDKLIQRYIEQQVRLQELRTRRDVPIQITEEDLIRDDVVDTVQQEQDVRLLQMAAYHACCHMVKKSIAAEQEVAKQSSSDSDPIFKAPFPPKQNKN
ncbi:unnamed protein product [Caenorhabditis sp. 36 PRJEB53466]|nr:unnamed protein product [Caenorhabditis sp. 36 PRJEB53466]